MYEIAVLPSRRIAGLISLAVLTSLTACANGPTSKNLEQILAADPKLTDKPVAFGSSNNANQPTQIVELPADFPNEIPRYPNAQLQEVTQQTPPATGEINQAPADTQTTRWVSSDPSNLIASFYQREFQANNWNLIQPNANQEGTIGAQRNDLQATVSIRPVSATNTTDGATSSPTQPDVGQNSDVATEFVIQYTRNPAGTQAVAPQQGDPNFVGPVLPQQPTQQATIPDTNSPVAATGTSFTDISKAPQELRQYIEDLAALDVLPLESDVSKSNQSTLEPNKTISRRDYARWLVAASNTFHANNPAQQIRPAAATAQPAFRDVPPGDPDFPVIQGLAEAGLIPSSLSGSTAVLFRPDAPLTREQLILWKVPLDTRQALPNASLDTVKQTWGFQDAARIDSQALRAVLADFQNTDQSNIRRVFGYTTLFQPKKPVTRAEAAAALWYFGTSSDGLSAKDALKLKNQPQPSATPSGEVGGRGAEPSPESSPS